VEGTIFQASTIRGDPSSWGPFPAKAWSSYSLPLPQAITNVPGPSAISQQERKAPSPFAPFVVLVIHDIRSIALTVHTTADRSLVVDCVANEDIERSFLQEVQAYLRLRSERRPPAPPLVEAWEQFYKRYAPFVLRTLGCCRVQRADWEDCAQEVWVEIITSLPKLAYDPTRGCFSSWLSVLIRRKVRHWLHHDARTRGIPLDDSAAQRLRARDCAPSDHCEQCELQRQVRTVLAHLCDQTQEENRLVLYLRWVEERDVSEIATAVGLTPHQIRCRCHRAKKKIQRLFEVFIRNPEAHSLSIRNNAVGVS